MKKEGIKVRRMEFSPEMAQAIDEGRKTLTRRLVKWKLKDIDLVEGVTASAKIPCKAGDIIAVCEPWYTLGEYDKPEGSAHIPDDAPIEYGTDNFAIRDGRRRLARFMPYRFVRNFLRVTSVTMKRLQDVSLDEMRRDGVGDLLEDPASIAGEAFARAEHAKIGGVPLVQDPEMYGYAAYYDHLCGDGTWVSNPQVWVIRFEKCEIYNV